MSVNKKVLKKYSDEEIIDLILETGCSEYFGELYDRYALKIFQKSLSFTKNESEAKDVAHDVLVKVYVNLSSFGKKSKFSTWLYSVTYNHCVDHQNKKKRLMNLADEIKSIENETPKGTTRSDSELFEIRVETLDILLKRIKPAEKSILLMKYQDEFSIKEISEITQCGESAVKMKLLRAKAKLMNLYEQGK